MHHRDGTKKSFPDKLEQNPLHDFNGSWRELGKYQPVLTLTPTIVYLEAI